MDWKTWRLDLYRNLMLLKHGETEFEEVAMQIFKYQILWNPVYKNFVKSLGLDSKNIQVVSDIPFLPISAFKHYAVKTGDWQSRVIFKSSGTTAQKRSCHHILDLDYYKNHSKNLFEKTIGPVHGKKIIALLPSYQERENASLVVMVNQLIKQSNTVESGFYLGKYQSLADLLNKAANTRSELLLFGVGFSLMELMKYELYPNPALSILETGGMKGNREEIDKTTFHLMLAKHFGTENIYSEYGMTEMISQAYSSKGGLFTCPYSMRVFAREISDPMEYCPPNKTGGLNIIDLSNIDSCAYIATEDIGAVDEKGNFSVTGRLNMADLRGCNLMLAQIDGF